METLKGKYQTNNKCENLTFVQEIITKVPMWKNKKKLCQAVNAR